MRNVRMTIWLLVLVGSAQATTVEWSVSEGGNGHFYEAVHVAGGIDWVTASAAATDAGGYLATITSAEENEFVFSLINDSQYWLLLYGNYQGPWIGGFQPPNSQEPAEGWAWVTGEPFDFTAWDPVQPNNSGGGDQDRIHFWNQFEIAATWQDINQNATMIPGYVVEVPEPTTLLLLGLGGLMLRRQR